MTFLVLSQKAVTTRTFPSDAPEPKHQEAPIESLCQLRRRLWRPSPEREEGPGWLKFNRSKHGETSVQSTIWLGGMVTKSPWPTRLPERQTV